MDQSNGSVVVVWHDARNDVNNRKVDYYTMNAVDAAGLVLQLQLLGNRRAELITTEGRLLRDFELDPSHDYQPQRWG